MAIDIRKAGLSRAQGPEARPGRRGLLGARTGLRVTERMLFTERLALLIETGSPLHTALETLEGQAPNPAVRDTLRGLVNDVAEGATFSQALARRDNAFPPTYVNLVAAAERGGFLAEILKRLVEMDEKRRELSSALVSAFSYPAFLVVFSTVVVIFILTFVFPKFADLFALLGDNLPRSTVALLALSDLMRGYWLPLVAGAAALGFFGVRWMRTSRGAGVIDGVLLGTPFVRDILVQLHLVQFMRSMSLSLEHGVPLLDALHACADVVKSPRFRRFVRDLEARVTQGGALGPGFREATFLPELVPQMMSTAEASGNLAMVMDRVADFYEREWKKRLLLFAKIAEPVMLLVMGVVVGLIVSSLILPIFRIASAVH